MKRLILLLIHNPLYIFQLIFYWIKFSFYNVRGIKTVVVNLHHTYFYNILESLYLGLDKHPEIRIFISYKKSNAYLRSYLLSYVDKSKLLNSQLSPFLPFSMFICPEITGPDFPFKLLKTIKVETFHGNGTGGFLEKSEVIRRFDALFAIGPKFNDVIDLITKDSSRKPRIYNVGYPKLDELFKHTELTDRLKQEYCYSDKPVILYAPHWNPYGSLHSFDSTLIEIMAKLDVTLLVKPHHYIFSKYAEDNWKDKLNTVCDKYDNVVLVSRPNTQELYPLSDLMVTDTGTSAPFEFSVLSKPFLMFDNQDWFENEEYSNEDYSYEERRIGECAIPFTKATELEVILTGFLSSSDIYMEARSRQLKNQKKMIADLLYNPGRATEAALEAILGELGLK